MFKKKQALPFGGSVPPDCSYCSYNGQPGDSPVCTLGRTPGAEGGCPKYLYDPLLRDPRPAPTFKPNPFNPEDFKL
ncbi:hypothetical protein [Acutalibacter caecimuris]|uniref:hypothetical protein n=1 Tax=Acutalibacter caecimuris TaxID=3093657 RepID=UPI002AC8D464|nr:hypothetical protein [Acutalibacter sp. M00118]